MTEAVSDVMTASRNDTERSISAAVESSKDAVPMQFDLSVFKGGVSDNFEWLKRFNRLAQANNWTEDRKKNVLAFYLRGSAE